MNEPTVLRAKPNPIVLALDGLPMDWALTLVDKIRIERGAVEKDLIWGIKMTSMITLDGFHICQLLKNAGFRVFADMKYYDIPSTMVGHIRTLYDSVRCDIITVHTAARFNEEEVDNSYIAGVSVLTSMSDNMCRTVRGANRKNIMLNDASFAEQSGYGYFVCSSDDLNVLQNYNFKKIVPGIRPEWSDVKRDNQIRTATPQEAIEKGADLLVIGRPILQSKNPIDVILRLNEDLGLL